MCMGALSYSLPVSQINYQKGKKVFSLVLKSLQSLFKDASWGLLGEASGFSGLDSGVC